MGKGDTLINLKKDTKEQLKDICLYEGLTYDEQIKIWIIRYLLEKK